MEQDREEGEMSDDVEMLEHDESDKHKEQNEDTISTIFYKADKNGLLVKKLDKIDAAKIEERAKRFGLDLTGNKLITQKQIDELYSNFGIQSGNARHFRFDALHLSGVYGLTTKDIFQYLQDYKPLSLEWVDEDSCNVVCQDHISVALALLVHSREIISEEIKKKISAKSSYHWREGVPHLKKDMILMRFATNSDKKNAKKVPEQKLKSHDLDKHKNPWGDLCQSWGVYDHQEVFQRQLGKNDHEDNFEEEHEISYQPILLRNEKLAKRLGKRNHNVVTEETSSDSDSEWKTKTKTPRMRMHADDVETNTRRSAPVEIKDEFAPLSIEVSNKRSLFRPRESKIVSDRFKRFLKPSLNSSNIQSRLGVKVCNEDDYSTDGSLSDSSDHNIMSRVEKVKRNQNNSVWSRLDIERSTSGEQSDLRNVLKTKKHRSNDLRERLGKSKQANLRIEIDNS